MVSIWSALSSFLSALVYLYPALNDELKEGKVTDFMATLTRDNPRVVSLLPSVLRTLSPNLHPPGNLAVVRPIVPNPKPGTWIYNSKVEPVTPTKDAFYNPPSESYEKLSNGDIIAIRQVGVDSILKNASSAFHISYRSESTLGEPSADLTLVVIPKGYDGKTVISYQTPEDAAFLQCAPSYSISSGEYDQILDDFLAEGWALNIPDHEGTGSAFGAGIKSGKATLDSLRALKNAQSILKLNVQDIALHGYSGGSIATGHALELQPTYAPDLHLKAAAVGGYVVNLTATFETINGGLFAGFTPAALLGLSSEYPELANVLNAEVKPDYRDRFFSPNGTCAAGNLVNYFGQDIYTYLKEGRSFLNNNVLQKVLDNNQLGMRAPTVPLLVYQGVQDEIAPVADVDTVVSAYCRGGTRLHYSRQNALAHVSAFTMSVADVVDFLGSALAGYVPPQCSTWESAVIPNQHSISLKDLPQLLAGLF